MALVLGEEDLGAAAAKLIMRRLIVLRPPSQMLAPVFLTGVLALVIGVAPRLLSPATSAKNSTNAINITCFIKKSVLA